MDRAVAASLAAALKHRDEAVGRGNELQGGEQRTVVGAANHSGGAAVPERGHRAGAEHRSESEADGANDVGSSSAAASSAPSKPSSSGRHRGWIAAMWEGSPSLDLRRAVDTESAEGRLARAMLAGACAAAALGWLSRR